MNKREYIQANKDWLMAKSKEEGVNALSKGIYYKVLSESNPDTPKPTVRSIITAHYTGKTIDGNQFDNGFSDSEKYDFWDDFDNLQKAKIVR
jgi:FKBP-type peptidyl-prolyl cis-trans isomerase